MEKIKITVEQEKSLEKYKNAVKEKNWLSGYVNYRDSWVDTSLSCLEKLSFNDFSLILHGWYEVEQPFKVGDWVYDKGFEEYRKIEDDNYVGGKYNTVSILVVISCPKGFEKVTEPWKIMLLELGRDKPEFHTDDVIITNSEVYKSDWLTDKEIIDLFDKGLIKEFHAYENRIVIKEGE